MKKTIPGWDDNRITPSCGNVFIDLGFDEAEAEILLIRADLTVSLEKHIASQGWTRAETAKRLGITRPRVSKLKKRAWQEFSLDMLLTLAARAGLHPELRLAA